VVSAYQVYEDYFQGLEATLGEWMYNKMQSDMAALSTNISPSASETVNQMLS
jgi:hypothetical protein